MINMPSNNKFSASIPVISANAYRQVRLRMQSVMSALGVCESQRALAVAEFSLLYRALNPGSEIELQIDLDYPHIDFLLKCQAPPMNVENLCKGIKHFRLDQHLANGADTTILRMHRRYECIAIPDTEQAQRWLQESTSEELRLKATQTEEANAAKREFLSRMSHELRTPMNAIIGMTHLALRTDLDERQRDYLEKINTAGQNLLGIINDILDFSKIEAGKLNLESTDFSLDKVLDEVATLVAPKAIGKGIEFLFDIDDKVPERINGDPLRVSQVLINLLANAVKFTERGEITLRVELLGQSLSEIKLQFTVQDTGIGMTEAQIANLFQAFSQADVSTTRRFGGTGLGLSICQRLLELMGGGISVSSTIGKGSCFSARASFAPAQSATRRVVPDTLNQLRVLVVDDNESAREILAGMLDRSLPLGCDTVCNGEDALQALDLALAEGHPYGLILLDWKLEDDLDGLSIAKLIRSKINITQPRMVLMTAYDYDDAYEHAPAGLLDGFLSKPIQPSDLIDTLVELFGDSGTPSSLAQSSQRQQRQRSHPQEWGLKGLKVLLVEDNLINQQIAIELLEYVGVQTSTACNGREALAWLENHNHQECDLVLMDINMPEMDGLECVRRIRSFEKWQQLPVLAMTAYAMQQERDECLALGMQDHISKPINPNQLYSCLQRWSGRESTKMEALPAHEDVSQPLFYLEGFDTAGALERVAGNIDLYCRLLMSMSHTQADALERLDYALAQHDFVEAAFIAHTVKGVSSNLGAINLANAASALDSELRQGSYSLETRNIFAEELQCTLDQLQSAFAALEPSGVDPPPPVPAAISLSDSQRHLLNSLNESLLLSDGEALDLIERQRESLIAILGRDGYQMVATPLLRFDFIAAQRALQHYLIPALED